MRLLLMLSLISLAACTPRPNENKNPQAVGILGGHAVSPSSAIASSVVALVAESGSSEYLCSGVLISEDSVLTAAHCGMDLDAGEIVFSSDLSTLSSDTRRDVEDVAITPQFESSPYSSSEKNWGDLAILKFSGGIPSGFQPAQIADANLVAEQLITIAGYGLTDGEAQTPSNKLRSVQVPILDPNYSESEFSVNQSGGKGACHGDSGGPAFVQQGENLYLMGIVSRGVDDECKTASIETRVSFYLDWIREVVQGG